ncbi:MAG: hypothetical protein HC880_15785 [Bacteroidia bacterium]|nr:hypothetical protein [Bacteroidia bacterium]
MNFHELFQQYLRFYTLQLAVGETIFYRSAMMRDVLTGQVSPYHPEFSRMVSERWWLRWLVPLGWLCRCSNYG